MSPEPGFGLKLGAEIRFERSHPVSIAGVCSRTFGDALQRLARYKQLTCPEEIRVHRKAQETSVEFFFIEAKEAQPDIMVDLGLSWILSVGRRGSDGEIKPLRLELTRPVKHRGLLEKHFGCRVRFNADRDALVFRGSELHRFLFKTLAFLSSQRRRSCALIVASMKSNLIRKMQMRRMPLVLGLVLVSLFMLVSAFFGAALYCVIALMTCLFGGYPTWNGALSFAVLFAFGFPLLLLLPTLADSEDP